MTVLIVDDHAEYRSAARRMLESEGFVVVGEAGDGHTALTETDRLEPAMVLLDVQLPDVDGFAIADRLAGRPNAPVIVLISTRPADAYRSHIESSAARTFIAKADLTVAALLDLMR